MTNCLLYPLANHLQLQTIKLLSLSTHNQSEHLLELARKSLASSIQGPQPPHTLVTVINHTTSVPLTAALTVLNQFPLQHAPAQLPCTLNHLANEM